MNTQLKLTLLVIISGIISCTSTVDPYEFNKDRIGLLTDTLQVKDLKLAFPNDTILRYISGDEFAGSINKIEIFDKESKKILLELSPTIALDTTATIRTIRILDERFKNKNGLGISSTFKKVRDNYKISSIQNTINNLIISIDEINVFFTIKKTELPAEMRFDMDLKIDPIQIPDEAKINNFFIQWY